MSREESLRNRQHPYLPHTPEDVNQMLQSIGVEHVDDLFSDIPRPLRLKGSLGIPEGVSEYEALELMKRTAGMNLRLTSFLGCGIYDHIIPAAVGQVTANPAFSTSYTPYQAEMSQGMLQAIFEFQTLICRLTGLDVSNASLYDGHTAAAEAAAIALQVRRKADVILVSQGVHPFTRAVLETYYRDSGITIQTIPLKQGATDVQEMQRMLDSQTAAVILQTPNSMGVLEDFTGFSDEIHEHKALCVISSNPMSLGVCTSQGEWGADIAIGDTQCFGLTQSFGGPTAGYIAARQSLLRKLPGRIVGETVDTEGKRAFVLTLQAREQHIKRERATSNICSNQALAALATSAYLACVGPEGLTEVGRLCMQKARYLHNRLKAIPDIKMAFTKPFFHEFCLKFASSDEAEQVLSLMRDRGYFAGVHLGKLDEAFNGLVALAVTEKRTRAELDGYADAMQEVLTCMARS